MAECELPGDGFLGEPVNALTSLSFLVAGAIVVRRERVRWVGYALMATGAGSFLDHGPMPPGSTWAHDVSLAWLLLVVAGLGRQWETFTRLPGLLALAVSLAIFPAVAIPVEILLTVAAVGLHLSRGFELRTIAAMLMLGAVALFGRLGSGGGPLCDPDSLWQPHGVWHIGAAAIVAWWVLGLEVPLRWNDAPADGTR